MSDTDTLVWVVKALYACHSEKLTIRSINRSYRLPHKNTHPALLIRHEDERGWQPPLTRWLTVGAGLGDAEWDIQSNAVPAGWVGWWEVGSPLMLEKDVSEKPFLALPCRHHPLNSGWSHLSCCRFISHVQNEIGSNHLSHSHLLLPRVRSNEVRELLGNLERLYIHKPLVYYY